MHLIILACILNILYANRLYRKHISFHTYRQHINKIEMMLFSDLLMCDPSVPLALDYKIQYVRCFKVSFGVEGRHGGGGEYKLPSQHQSSLLLFSKISSFHHGECPCIGIPISCLLTVGQHPFNTHLA